MGCAISDTVTESSSNSQPRKQELKVHNQFVYRQAPKQEEVLLHQSMQLSLYPQANIQVEIEEEKSQHDSVQESVDNKTSVQPSPPQEKEEIEGNKELQFPNCEQLLLIMINELRESGQIAESLKLIEQNAYKYPEACTLSKLMKMVKQNNEKPMNQKLEDQFYRFFQTHLLEQIASEREKHIQLSGINHQLLIHYSKYILKKGMSYMGNKFYEKAEKKFQTYAEIAKITGSILMLCEGRRCLGLIQHKKGNFIKAIQIFTRCIDTMNEANISPAEKLKPLKNLAEVYSDQQRYEKAIEVYTKCEAIVSQVGGMAQEEIKLLELIGQVQWKRKQYQLAHSYFEKCLDIQTKATGLSSYESVGYLIKLSMILIESGSSQSCLDILEGCLKTVRQSQWQAKKKRQVELNIQKILFNHYKNKAQYIEALQCLYTSLALIELNEGKSNLDYSEILKEIGIIQELQFNYHEALKFYDQSLSIKQKINSKDERTHIEVLMKLANIYQRLNNNSKSLKYKDNIMKIQQKYRHSNQKEHLNTFINIAKKTLEKGNYPQSLIYYQKCVGILQDQKGKDCIELAQIYQDIGSVYKLQGVFKEAMSHFNECLAILQKHKGKDCMQAAQSYYQLASIYEEISNYEAAQTYYKNALSICEKYNIKYQTYANSNLGLGNLYFCQSLYSQAYKAYEKSLAVLEKMNPNKYQLAVQQMQACDSLIQMQFPSEKDVENQD